MNVKRYWLGVAALLPITVNGQPVAAGSQPFAVASQHQTADRLPLRSEDIQLTFTVDSLGACQGASYQDGYVYLCGDREVGVMRQYQAEASELVYTGVEGQLTEGATTSSTIPPGSRGTPDSARLWATPSA